MSAQSAFDGDRVLVVLKSDDGLLKARSTIESRGGHVIHVFPRRILHAYVTKKTQTELASADFVDLVTSEPVDHHTMTELSSTETQGIRSWNNLFVTTVESKEKWGSLNSDPIPTSSLATPKYQASTRNQGYNSLTSQRLVGSVSVGIVFVESNGIRDRKTETWTAEDKEDAIDQIYNGLEWWSQMGGFPAHLSWTYDIKQCTTNYEPISRNKSESPIWVNECMSQLGYLQGEDFERTRSYANDLKSIYQTDWSFIVFVVPARQDTDGYFADKSGIAWAYVGGPYMVLPNKCSSWGYRNVWKVVAHETGHIFNALDEYETIAALPAAGMSNVTAQPNNGDHINDVCMMKSNDPFLCNGTREQIGWIDKDDNGVYDIDDVKPSSRSLDENNNKNELSPARSKLIFFENFSRQSDWFEDRNNYIRNGAYTMYDSTYGSSSWLERDYYDFKASVRTQWIEGSAASGYGLMVRVKTATDGYIFFINKHGQFSFGKYVNGSWKYLEEWSFSEAIRLTGENVLKAECQGNRFRLYINDEQVSEVFDDTFLYGNVGLAVLPDIRVSFDDLTILAP